MVGYCCRGWCWLGLAMTGFALALRKLPWRRSLHSYLCPYIWDFTASPTSGTLSCDSSGEKKCIAIVEMHGQVSEWSRVAVAIQRKSVKSTRSGFQDGTDLDKGTQKNNFNLRQHTAAQPMQLTLCHESRCWFGPISMFKCVCVFAAFFTSHGWDCFIPVTGFDEAFPSASQGCAKCCSSEVDESGYQAG